MSKITPEPLCGIKELVALCAEVTGKDCLLSQEVRREILYLRRVKFVSGLKQRGRVANYGRYDVWKIVCVITICSLGIAPSYAISVFEDYEAILNNCITTPVGIALNVSTCSSAAIVLDMCKLQEACLRHLPKLFAANSCGGNRG